MYELVKKKNLATRILIGILIFFAITQLLKIAFQQPARTLDDELVMSANEINKHAPIILDSLTRLDNVMALPGGVLQYNYTILTVERTNIDTIVLKENTRQSLMDKIKNDPKAKYFRENNIELQAMYYDKDARYLCSVSVTAFDYKK